MNVNWNTFFLSFLSSYIMFCKWNTFAWDCVQTLRVYGTCTVAQTPAICYVLLLWPQTEFRLLCISCIAWDTYEDDSYYYVLLSPEPWSPPALLLDIDWPAQVTSSPKLTHVLLYLITAFNSIRISDLGLFQTKFFRVVDSRSYT